MEFVWEKPTIVFYKERHEKPEREALAVIKARKLIVSRKEDQFSGSIIDFFPLMGDIDYISTKEGKFNQYVLCWFDDNEDDFHSSWRRLTGVNFSEGITLTYEKDKKSYNANFKAEQGKLN